MTVENRQNYGSASTTGFPKCPSGPDVVVSGRPLSLVTGFVILMSVFAQPGGCPRNLARPSRITLALHPGYRLRKPLFLRFLPPESLKMRPDTAGTKAGRSGRGVKVIMARKYFGTDGIRGRANGVITADLALRVGQAAGVVFRRGDYRNRVVIGKDTRLSGYMIEMALASGICSLGVDVLPDRTHADPGIAFLTQSQMRCDAGIQISGEPRPVRRQRHQDLLERRVQAARRPGRGRDRAVDRLVFSKELAKSDGRGRAKRIEGAHSRYIDSLKRTLAARSRARGVSHGRRLRQRRRLQGRPRRCGSSAPR